MKKMLSKIGNMALLVCALIFSQEKTLAEEQQKKRDIGLGSLERIVDVPNQKGIMIHVRQKHLPLNLESHALSNEIYKKADGDVGEILALISQAQTDLIYSKNNIKSINESQRQIYEFLKSEKVDIVYCEGFPRGYSPSREEAQQNFNKSHIYLSTLMGTTDDKEFYEYLKQYYYAPGAAYLLAKNRCKVIGADLTREEVEKGVSELVNGNDEIVMSVREEKSTQYVLGDNSNSFWKILIYGAGHDFKDDVEKWNQEHPDKRYDLATFTPRELIGGENEF